jgi:asparagine synthetase A
MMEWVDFVFEVVKGLCEDPRLIVERDDNHHIGISMMLMRPDHPEIKPWKSVVLDVWAFEENNQRQTDLLKECIGGIRVGGNQGFL